MTVPIYPTSSPSQVAYILGHAGIEACFVDTRTQLAKLMEIRDLLPALKRAVISDGPRRAGDSFVVALDALRGSGAKRLRDDSGSVDERARQVRPEDLATIVYTSGTSGPPKGAMLSHSNIMWALRKVTPVYDIGEGDRLLSFLPLSHIAERMMSDFLPIAVAGETWFARNLATVAEDLPACRPTVFLAVPRLWEKLRETIEADVRAQALPVRVAVERYIELGLRNVTCEQEGSPVNKSTLALYRTLDLTVGSALRRALGLDHARVLVTTAAPAHPELIRWFHAIGLPLLQLYGLTEGCGPTAANRAGRVRIGTVGTAMPGMTVTIAEDDEILLKGGNVCLGYLNDPEATAELIDGDGWMHTGDTGAFDADGSLRILGRKKDIIITASRGEHRPRAHRDRPDEPPPHLRGGGPRRGPQVPGRPSHARPGRAHALGTPALQARRSRSSRGRPRSARGDPSRHRSGEHEEVARREHSQVPCAGARADGRGRGADPDDESQAEHRLRPPRGDHRRALCRRLRSGPELR